MRRSSRQSGIDVPPAEQVERLARLAHEAKLDGIVCSPIEAAQMRELLGPNAIIITPGRATQGRRARRPEPRRHARRSLCRRRVPISSSAGPSRVRPIPVAAFDEIAANLD